MDERQRAWDVLDAQDGTGPAEILDSRGAGALLDGAHRIAIVGASPNPARPSHGVMSYLLEQGYDVVPINPNCDEVLGVRAHPSLEEAVAVGGPFDIVDVFRRAEHTPDIARSTVETGSRALWLQLGVVNWDAAQIASAAGLPVVMDRCTSIEHRRIGG